MRKGSAASISRRAAVSSRRRAMVMLSMREPGAGECSPAYRSQYATSDGRRGGGIPLRQCTMHRRRVCMDLEERCRSDLAGGLFEPGYLIGLGAFGALYDVELYL